MIVLTFPNFPLTFPEYHSIFIDPCVDKLYAEGPLNYNICTHLKVGVRFRGLFDEKWACLTEIKLKFYDRSWKIIYIPFQFGRKTGLFNKRKPNFQNRGNSFNESEPTTWETQITFEDLRLNMTSLWRHHVWLTLSKIFLPSDTSYFNVKVVALLEKTW